MAAHDGTEEALAAPAATAQGWALTIKNLFLPTFCKQCGQRLLTEENGFFCPQCWEASPRIERPFCTCCGRAHDLALGFGQRSNFLCAECREKPLPHIHRMYGAAHYADAVALAVKLFKFYGRERLAIPLAELLGEFIEKEMDTDRYTLILPVPLHRVRRRARGYNQSALLATTLLPFFPKARYSDALQRIRPTRTQSKLTGAARRANVRGAFAFVGEAINGAHCLLVDDVVTTGGTVSECAQALKRAGAGEVDVLAVALAGRHNN